MAIAQEHIEAFQAVHGEEYTVQFLACEPKMFQFRDEDGNTDYEDFDYYHMKWEEELLNP